MPWIPSFQQLTVLLGSIALYGCVIGTSKSPGRSLKQALEF